MKQCELTPIRKLQAFLSMKEIVVSISVSSVP